jgi:hypothetical protein
MPRFLVLAFLALSLSITAYGSESNCPAASPAKRPNGAQPAKWNLSKILTQMVHPVTGLVLVTAHRGNWEYCPENTLEAFQSSWDMTAEAAEMDVRLSAPGRDPVRRSITHMERYFCPTTSTFAEKHPISHNSTKPRILFTP